MSLIEFKDVSKIFQGPNGQVNALDKVSFSISSGELFIIRGPSGCGKTTLLFTAGGMLHPNKGKVNIDGLDFYGMDTELRTRKRADMIGFVFQQFHLIPYLNIKDNILSASIGHNKKTHNSICDKLLEQFGLQNRAYHFPSQLSVGEKQRTALARALFNHPKIILADEPTGNLDEDNAGIVFKVLQEFVNNNGTVLLVSHDTNTKKIATNYLSMQQGKINYNS